MWNRSRYLAALAGALVCLTAGVPAAAAPAKDDPFDCRNNPKNCLPGDPPPNYNRTTSGADSTGVPPNSQQDTIRENRAKLACNKLKTPAARQTCLDNLP